MNIMERRRREETRALFEGQLDALKKGETARLRESGLVMTDAQQSEFDTLCAGIFSHPRGDELLAWLSKMTLDQIAGPGVEPNQLLHLEGQRYFCSLLLNAVIRGRAPRAQHTEATS